MSYDVLVVDDHLQTAKEYARLVKVKTKLNAIATDDPDEAIEIAKSNLIKVALLDQRMPKKDGTELFRELVRISPLMKGVMITGEADAGEVGDAILNLGFSDYIHKSDVESIAPRVLLHYCAYHTDLAERSTSSEENLLYTHRHGLPWFGHSIDWHLIETELLNEEYIFSNHWKTIVKIDAGERKKHSVAHQRASRFVVESEEKMKLLGSASLKHPLVSGITAKLEAAVESRFKSTATSEEGHTEAIEREFQLPDEPIDPSIVHIKSRQYEHAPVYRQVRAVIKKVCNCCDGDEIVAVTVFHLTDKTATRQIDFMSDGTSKTVHTGVTL